MKSLVMSKPYACLNHGPGMATDCTYVVQLGSGSSHIDSLQLCCLGLKYEESALGYPRNKISELSLVLV